MARALLALLLATPTHASRQGGYTYEEAAPPDLGKPASRKTSPRTGAAGPSLHAVMGEAFGHAKRAASSKPLLHGIIVDWDGSGSAEAHLVFYDPAGRRRIALGYRLERGGFALKSLETRTLTRSGGRFLVRRTLRMTVRGELGSPAEDSVEAKDGSVAECSPIDVRFVDVDALKPAGKMKALLFNPAGRSCDQGLSFFNAQPKGSWQSAIALSGLREDIANVVPDGLLGRSLWGIQRGDGKPYYLDAGTGRDLGGGKDLIKRLDALPAVRLAEPASAP